MHTIVPLTVHYFPLIDCYCWCYTGAAVADAAFELNLQCIFPTHSSKSFWWCYSKATLLHLFRKVLRSTENWPWWWLVGTSVEKQKQFFKVPKFSIFNYYPMQEFPFDAKVIIAILITQWISTGISNEGRHKFLVGQKIMAAAKHRVLAA